MENKHYDGREFDFLIGKSIIKVEKEDGKSGADKFILTCKDETIIEIKTNEGCGGCSNGWSSFDELKKLERNDNVITNIKTEYSHEWDEDIFKMFVYYADGTINKLEGNDGYGNGYYGGGFYITIKNVKKGEIK